MAAVLAAGDTDWRTVQLIIVRTELVSDSAIARLDSNLAHRISKWHSWSRNRIINAVDAAVRAMDPDAIRERVRLEDNRHVDVTAVGDGTAKVDGIIATDAAAAFDKQLTELATAVCSDDRRSRRCDPNLGSQTVSKKSWFASVFIVVVILRITTSKAAKTSYIGGSVIGCWLGCRRYLPSQALGNAPAAM